MSRFYFGDESPSHSDSASDNDSDLPYPAPLPRNAFLAPSFSPQTYLSTLHNRHQTLEDLRSELRARSSLLSRELLDLVNSNYQDFLGLGRSLRGGDEKVEEVRVGLLGFRKEVEGLRERVLEREEEVGKLVEEKEGIRKEIAVGRALLGYEARLKRLEELLVIEMTGKDGEDASDSEEDSDDDDEGDAVGISISRLRRHVSQFRVVQQAEKELGKHPFVIAQAPRMIKVRNTLLLDLSTALQQAKSAKASGRVMKIMKVYADMDESTEVVKVLKALKA